MSKHLNTFVQKEYIPLKQFRLKVIEIIFDKPNSNLTDAEIFDRLRKLTEDSSNEEEKNSKETSASTHWALMNLS